MGMVIPEQIQSLVDPNQVLMNPYKGLGLKPDGSKFRCMSIHVWMGDDWQYVAKGFYTYHFEQSGMSVSAIDAAFSTDVQMGYIEDTAAAKNADFIIIEPADSVMLNPAIQRALDAGIPTYEYIIPTSSPVKAGWAGYRDEGPGGIDAIGKLEAAEAAKNPNQPYKILELWGQRANVCCQNRDAGWRLGLDLANHPNIEIIESAETMGLTELMMAGIVDGFAANPDIKAIYAHFGDGSGFVSGLKAVNKYAPVGDPNHIFVVPNDTDRNSMAEVEKGYFDGCGSLSSWHTIDLTMKQVFWHTVLGQDVPMKAYVPYYVMTKDNYMTLKVNGGAANFIAMPMNGGGDWALWPTLNSGPDSDSVRDMGMEPMPTPTVADRQALLGY